MSDAFGIGEGERERHGTAKGFADNNRAALWRGDLIDDGAKIWIRVSNADG